MTMKLRFGTALVASAAAMLVLVACGNESGAGGAPTVNPSESGSSVPTPGGAAPTGTPGGTAVEQATADLVKKLGVQAAGVKVVSAEEITWSDGSLGCPEEGMRYTQALINGMRIILEADGKKYEYHSGGSRAPFLCENPQAR
ncbi:hypothetical protein E1263_36015 [Kribbella antibiotica]|uniref:Uncharacterized protein n=1 Tax=Kribbella antibiotica TaxID=190195 RepID=A0A4R4YQ28_9ACTN|nr:hypothetical protein [Kribbella antibiotica]TDD46690.1 hypothetical protein E1263_36015 [Kribbella antibiotica]